MVQGGYSIFVRGLLSRVGNQNVIHILEEGGSFRSLAKVSPKMVGKFLNTWAGLFSSIVFVVCLGPAMQNQKFLATLGLMDTEKGIFYI